LPPSSFILFILPLPTYPHQLINSTIPQLNFFPADFADSADKAAPLYNNKDRPFRPHGWWVCL
ncbi:MAG: hypothetical protein ACXIU2_13630, partial [Cyclobacteriaceae bacterium]